MMNDTDTIMQVSIIRSIRYADSDKENDYNYDIVKIRIVSTIIDFGQIYRYMVKYVDKLLRVTHCTSELPIIHTLATNTYYSMEEDVNKLFPTMKYDPSTSMLFGEYNDDGESHCFRLNDDNFIRNLEELRRAYMIYKNTLQRLCKEYTSPTGQLVDYIWNNSYKIGEMLYNQLQTLRSIRYDYAIESVPGTNCMIQFTESPDDIILIKNSEAYKIASISGLTYNNLLKLSSYNTPKYLDPSLDNMRMDIRRMFDNYICNILEHLELTNITFTLPAFYQEIMDVINKRMLEYEERKSKISTFVEDTPDWEEEENDTNMEPIGDIINTIPDTCIKVTGQSMNMDKIKWLLLYIMDIELDGVAHGLPVYLYEDERHGISAIFNYWKGLPNISDNYMDTYIDFVSEYTRYKMKVVTDIMNIAENVNLAAYADYIGGKPNVKVILDKNMSWICGESVE